MAVPSLTHQRLLGSLYRRISNCLEAHTGDCEVLLAPFAVFLNEKDRQTYLEPDLSVVCDPHKLDEKGCHGALDWVIEIVSPSSKPRDYIKKMIQYHMAGVREYWIVDDEKNRITVYNYEHESIEEYAFSDQVKVGIYKDFAIDFAKIRIKHTGFDL